MDDNVIDLNKERAERNLEQVKKAIDKATECHVLTPEQIALIDDFLEEFKDCVEII